MSDERIAQVLNNAGIVHEIPGPQAFAIARVAMIYPAQLHGFCTSYKIKICGCRPGCFP